MRNGQRNNLKEPKNSSIIQPKIPNTSREYRPIQSQLLKKSIFKWQNLLCIKILSRQKDNKKDNNFKLNLWGKAKNGTKISSKNFNKISKNKIKKLRKSLDFCVKNYLTSALFKTMSGIEFCTCVCSRIVLRESAVHTVFCIVMKII